MWREPRRATEQAARDPRARDVVRRDRCGARHRRRPRALVGRLVAGGRSTRASAASSPRSPRGATSSSSHRSFARRSRPPEAARRRRAGRGHAGAGARRRAARRPLGGEGDRVGARRCRSSPSTTSRGTSPSLYLEHDPLEPPFVCLLASGGHTLLLAVRERALGAARHDARRRGRRGLRQGSPAAGSRLSGRRGARPARAGRDPSAFAFPVARVPGLDFSFSGLKTALLYTVRELGEDETERRRADLAASYQRAIVRALVARLREAASATGLERLAVVGGVAANSALRHALPRRALRAARPLHRQRGDDRVVRTLRRGASVPRYLALDAYASLA